jgi:hypothetical protein
VGTRQGDREVQGAEADDRVLETVGDGAEGASSARPRQGIMTGEAAAPRKQRSRDGNGDQPRGVASRSRSDRGGRRRPIRHEPDARGTDSEAKRSDAGPTLEGKALHPSSGIGGDPDCREGTRRHP